MKIGKCTEVMWKDVDFKKCSISVTHTAAYYTRDGVAGFAIPQLKTEAVIRYIPMMDTVYDALKICMKCYREM